MPFRFQSKFCFLTYPQCDIDKQVLLNSLLAKLPSIEYAVVSSEQHEDGHQHLHAFIVSSSRISTRDERYFDYSCEGRTFHPNIVKPNSPDDCREYVIKDGDFIEHGVYTPKKRKAPSYKELSDNASSKEEFMSSVYEHYPRDYFLCGERIEAMATKRFKSSVSDFVPTFTNFPNIPPLLSDWVNAYFVRPRRNRPKSLVLIGKSRFGKTEWARSLGSHVYVRGAWNAEKFKVSFDYIVLDDFDFSYLFSKSTSLPKAFFGCQGDVEISGKYVKTFTINTNCPIICLMNEDQFNEYAHFFNSEWGQANVEVITLQQPLF